MLCLRVLFILLFFSLSADAQEQASVTAEEAKQEEVVTQKGILEADFDNVPTFIKSKALTLKSASRVFEYIDNVEVKHGDMTLTCQLMEGTYSEDNQIKQLIAKNNVVIVKGENVRATGQKAIYNADSKTIELTGSPELQQDGSVLTADLIRIFLEEDRSTAEGEVRVKVVEEKDDKKKK